MHIAYVCSDRGVPIAGTKGASIHVRSLAQALSENHDVSLLAANPGSGALNGFRPRLHAVGYDRSLKRLKRRIAAGDPRDTKSREIYALLVGNLAYRRLHQLHLTSPIDAVYERHSLWSWAALAFARETGVPHVLEMNAPLAREQATYRELAMGDVAKACERELIAGSNAVVVPSDALAVHAVRLGARHEDVHVLPNAIDPELFPVPPIPSSQRQEQLRDRFVTAFAGSLKPWHGVEILLAAFQRLLDSIPDAHLLILGDGPLKTRVDAAARRFGSDRVTAPGAVSHAAVPGWLAQADVGVAPYPRQLDFYFSPMKVVEYQAAGLAAVASDLGHIRSQIEDLETGLLVPAGDPERLAEALAELARRPTLARRLGRQARDTVFTECTWRQVAEQVEALMHRHMAGPRLSVASGMSVR